MKKVKIITGLSLTLFLVTVTSLLTAALISSDSKSDDSTIKKIPGGESQSFLTLDEVGKHNKTQDCWLVIEGNVYNLTGFLEAHPGGAQTIISYCGKDGTKAFMSKDLNPAKKHSNLANNMLGQYLVGKLGQAIAINNNPGNTINATPTITPTNTSMKTVSRNQGSGLLLTTGEVVRHNNLTDCWLIISGDMYDVTPYIVQHPGGADAISRHCGTDATVAYATKDKSPGSGHTSYAKNLLVQYFVGTVGQTLTINPVVTTVPVVLPTIVSNIPTLPQATVDVTVTEVARHNNLADCWLIISGKVYNVTSYIVQHPGGVSAITNVCGQDGTTAFQTRGGGSNHSSFAYNLLNNFLIGTLNSAVPVNPANTPVPGNNNSTNTPTPGDSGTDSGLPTAITTKYPGATKISGKYEDNGSWEGKINYSGQCRAIKISSTNVITEEESC